MTKSTQDLAAELKTLEARRETLASEVEAARRKLEAARGALVSGTDAGKVTAAQSTYTALSEAVDALDARITDTRAELAASERVADLRAEAARGRAREERRRVLTVEIHALFESASAYLEGVVSTYFEKVAEWRACGAGHFRTPAGEPYGPAVALALNIESRRRERQRSNEASGRATARELQRQRAA
jgi:predicted  nucleic acid-binding Zn-ribbon protein